MLDRIVNLRDVIEAIKARQEALDAVVVPILTKCVTGDRPGISAEEGQQVAVRIAARSELEALIADLDRIIPYETDNTKAMTLGDLMPDEIIQDTVTGRFYVNMVTWSDNPNDAYVFSAGHNRELTNTQRFVKRSDAIDAYNKANNIEEQQRSK